MTSGDSQSRWVLVVAVALVLTTAGVFATRYTMDQAVYAARLSGTPGVLRVAECTPAARADDIVCKGLFWPDSGKPAVSVTVQADFRVGESVPVQRTDFGGYREVGFVPTAGWLAVTFFSLLVLCSGPWLASLLLPGRRLRRAGLVVSVALLGLMVACGLAAGVVAVAQAVL